MTEYLLFADLVPNHVHEPYLIRVRPEGIAVTGLRFSQQYRLLGVTKSEPPISRGREMRAWRDGEVELLPRSIEALIHTGDYREARLALVGEQLAKLYLPQEPTREDISAVAEFVHFSGPLTEARLLGKRY